MKDRMSTKEYRELMAPKKQSKYRAKKTVVDNMIFDSLKEANYYCRLKMLRDAGEILYFLRQVPFHLPGNVTYRIDFLEFHADGSTHYVDVKGFETQLIKRSKKQVEALFPVIIETV